MKPLPTYTCHKQVGALKIRSIDVHYTAEHAIFTPADESYAPFSVSRAYMAKHVPEAGGYYVRYKDGYESFSPAAAFEEGYTRD